VLRLRRGLGLYTFLYAAVHFLVFAGLDYGFGLDFLLPAIANQLFVLAGMGAFLLLLLLAITSTRGWQRRLGKRWKQLQRLVYLATIVDVVHVVWARKALLEAWPYFTVATLLLLLRLPPARRALARLRKGEEA
jgi:sulfoxide reductase heme-binding subunit YedZ